MNVVYINGEEYLPKQNVKSYLFIGLDTDGEMKASDSFNNAVQADFLLLAVLDEAKDTYSLLQINRDTMTPVNILDIKGEYAGMETMQIALSHTYGDGLEVSCENTVSAVSELMFGAEIDGYIAVTMRGLSEIVDSLGGVDICMAEDYTDIDPSFRKNSTVTLDGTLGLKFVRARMDVQDGSNLSRMERQRVFLDAIADKAFHQEITAGFINGLSERLSPYLLTDCSLEELTSILGSFSGAEHSAAVSPEGEAVMGDKYMEFYVDESKLRELIASVYYDKIK
ncbi:MAG: LCP family protein [Oscillospiraceae bacterium]|nr:LCP family protein [Oscillospiraceae bacterium]